MNVERSEVEPKAESATAMRSAATRWSAAESVAAMSVAESVAR